MTTTNQRSRYPDDAAMWGPLRPLSVREIATRLGVDYSGLAADLRERGWVRTRGQGSRLTHAPCRECSTSKEVETLTAERVCPVCAAGAAAGEPSPNVLLFRRELDERRDWIGSPEFRARYKRTGGPLADALRRRRAA